tara:strand:- start:4332 stop:5276 length:945 start_codon:yes stop_codon:yes gene_type:complete
MFSVERILRAVSDGFVTKFNPEKRAAIIYFHRVLKKKSPFYPDDLTLREFERLMKAMSCVFEMSSLDDIREPSISGKMRVAITFDDGYKDNIDAATIMEKFNIPCTFFVSTKGVEDGILWQDKIIENVIAMDSSVLNAIGGSYQGKTRDRASFAHEKQSFAKRLPPDAMSKMLSEMEEVSKLNHYPRLMMNEMELKNLSENPLFSIGGHTHSHAILTTLDGTSLGKEIVSNKKKLESIIGRKIEHFAYPNGRLGEDISLSKHPKTVLSHGYKFAYTTEDNGVSKDVYNLLIPRFMPYRKNPYLRILSIIKIAGE